MPNFIFQRSNVSPKELFFGKLNQDREKFFPVQYRRFSLPKCTKDEIFNLTRNRLKQTLLKECQAGLKPLQVFRPCISVQFADGAGERHSIVVQEQNGQYLVFISGLDYYDRIYLGTIEADDI